MTNPRECGLLMDHGKQVRPPSRGCYASCSSLPRMQTYNGYGQFLHQQRIGTQPSDAEHRTCWGLMRKGRKGTPTDFIDEKLEASIDQPTPPAPLAAPAPPAPLVECLTFPIRSVSFHCLLSRGARSAAPSVRFDRSATLLALLAAPNPQLRRFRRSAHTACSVGKIRSVSSHCFSRSLCPLRLLRRLSSVSPHCLLRSLLPFRMLRRRPACFFVVSFEL
uniref:Uncharacterized protein n=1 Tax=Ditylenchus dipsaci TaxID=166011 RepID=A0A915EUD2_9BILA